MTGPKAAIDVRTPRVHCRRIHLPLPIEEHLTCSYCFGKAPDVRTGEYERFCDFVEGRDPICFGFPET
jgi:hypothetical protein